MKREIKRIVWLIIVVLLLSSVFTGCGKDSDRRTESGMEALPEAKAFAGNPTHPPTEIASLEPIKEEPNPTVEIAPLEPIKEEPNHTVKIAPLEPIKEEPTVEIAPLEPIKEEPVETKPTQTPKPSQKSGNTDWVINVDDNETTDTFGIKYRSNLYVSMNKSGGRDSMGTYTGKILYTSTVDEDELEKITETESDEIFDTGYYTLTLEAVSAELEVVRFDAKKYAAQSGTASVRADFMAVGTIDMNMRHQTSVSTHDQVGNTGKTWSSPEEVITMPIEISLLINGGKVTAYFGYHPIPEAFSGMLTGSSR